MKRFFCLWVACFWSATMFAQIPNDAGKDLETLQKELGPIAFKILNGDSLDEKVELNKSFIVRLTKALERPESFDFAWDSLKTISILDAPDHSFRIFTWYLTDGNPAAYYGASAFYYFGLVQRKYVTVKGETQYIVIPLMEMEAIPPQFESTVTDNYAWFGAIYYKPKMHDDLMAYRGTYYKLEPIDPAQAPPKGQTQTMYHYTFTPGKYRSRTLVQTDLPKLGEYKRVKQTVDYYLLMGWNGWDNKSNYKVVDVLSFDPGDSSRVLFGAPIFYFDQVPKARALFKYSDNSAFTLNEGYVKRGPLGLFQKKMLVYDHLAAPNKGRPTDMFALGPDGSYDALSYFPRYGGYFEWYRDVKTASRTEDRKHRKYVYEKQLEAAAAHPELFPDATTLRPGQMARSNKRELKRQQKEARNKLKEAGFDPK